MRGNRARSDSDGTDYSEAIEYVCLCTPLWECIFDDYDNYSNSFTLRNRVTEWKHERRSRSLERKEAKKQGKLERSRSLERIEAHKKLMTEKSKQSKILQRAESKKVGKSKLRRSFSRLV
jgi:hypothetical protein